MKNPMDAVDDIPPQLKTEIVRAMDNEIDRQVDIKRGRTALDLFLLFRAGLAVCREALQEQQNASVLPDQATRRAMAGPELAHNEAGVPIVPADRDMICETHPWLPWPHDECGGPGCPPDAAVGLMQQRVRALQIAVQAREAMIVSAYFATADAPRITMTKSDAPGGEVTHCTGVAASWCPIHGTCTCPRDEAAWRVELNDPNCPLHSPESTHAAKTTREPPPEVEDAPGGTG